MDERRLYTRIRSDYVERMVNHAWVFHRSLSEEVSWLAEWAIDELERRPAADPETTVLAEAV